MKTKEEREQIVETASSLCSLDGYQRTKICFNHISKELNH